MADGERRTSRKKPTEAGGQVVGSVELGVGASSHARGPGRWRRLTVGYAAARCLAG